MGVLIASHKMFREVAFNKYSKCIFLLSMFLIQVCAAKLKTFS